MFKTVTAALLVIAALAPQVLAAPISGVTISASSELGGVFQRQASNVVSGTGLNATTGGFSNAPDGTMWLTRGSGAYQGPADTSPSITFDLGRIYNLTSADVWNYNENSGNPGFFTKRGVKTMDAQASMDGTHFATIATGIGLAQAPGTNNTAFAQTLTWAGTAEYIRFSNLASWGGDNGFVGLSQVQFFGTAFASPGASVPEPISFGLLGTGALAAAALRRHARR